MINTNFQSDYDHYLRRGTPVAALTTDATLTAGYQLPEDFDGKLTNALNSVSALRSLCTEITTGDDSALPILNSHGRAVWVPEGQPIPLVKDAFDRAVLTTHKLAAIIRVTGELLRDAAIDIEQYLADTFADRLSVSEEEAFIAGDGEDKPLGLIHQAKVGCMTETAGTVSIEDVLNLIFSLPEKHRHHATLLMNDNTLLQLYREAMAQGKQLLFGKTADGRTDTFFGMPIARCASMPDSRAGSIPVLCGDFRQVYINNCGKRGIKRLDELYVVNNHVGFLLAERVGIKLIVPDAMAALRVS